MKRLTQKILYDGKELYGSIGVPCDDLDYLELVYDKLGQLEDIEEKIGIDLITLFKALKDGAWFRNLYYFTKKINYIENLDSKIDFGKMRFDIRMDYFVKFYDYRTGGAFFLFKDYGITWALTKEELE